MAERETVREAFWRTICLFAYRRWVRPDARKPAGIPGQRDPDHPCHAYASRRRGVREWGDCEADGHHLCAGCAHLAPEGEYAIAHGLVPEERLREMQAETEAVERYALGLATPGGPNAES